ncbi:hypothetical protein J3B02_002796 [Coemansia erecta]|nr:hypothetical protein J3B02_002796 [Coemansia erecta]KAJ2877361.1 hypothetical protein FB639_003799 [Coemansia asiatica]
MTNTGVIIVSGASQGIGRQVCLYLAKHYPLITIIAVARSSDLLETLQQEGQVYGDRRIIPVVGSISMEKTQQDIVSNISDRPLLAVINNAAQVEPNCAILDVTADQWQSILETNLISSLSIVSRCIDKLQQTRGRVINITSSTSQAPVPAFSAYGVTKVAVNYVTAAIAQEHPDITAVAFYPGVVDTPMNHKALEAAASFASCERAVRANIDMSAVIEKLKSPIPADIPSAIIANLAVFADHKLSGKFFTYEDDEMEDYKNPKSI